ncbi:hypothetical protein D3C79_980280 [compost metagenome]
MLAASHGPDDRVAEQALVDVLAIKAQATATAQGANDLVYVEAAVLEHDVELRLFRGVDD